MDMDLEALGTTMQHDEYDLTIGAAGPAGPEGPQGAPGVDPGPVPGFDRYAIALSADQTIGSNGDKFIGLGDTSNTHEVAAIPIPWDGHITTIVGRSSEQCTGDGTVVFTFWLERVGGDPFATDIVCTISAGGPYEGQGCIASMESEDVMTLDLMSVHVDNNGCPSTQVSSVVGFASGSGPLPELSEKSSKMQPRMQPVVELE